MTSTPDPTHAFPTHPDHDLIRAGPLGTGPIRLLARIGEPLYRAVLARRNRDFDRGDRVTRLDRPVISVGNLSVGGTGKTPMVARVVDHLRQAGHSPCIAMRGYAKPRSGPQRISDEAEEYARLFPGLPVVAQPDRTAGLHALFATPAGAAVDVVVLDDGFQHRRIARDLDIVLLDASARSLEDHLLPRGWLREPVESLARAHAVVITHAERSERAELERIRARVLAVNPALLVAVCRHAWTGFQQGTTRIGPEGLTGRRVLAVCAIGNPRAFLAGIERAGATIADAITLRDHHPYDPDTVSTIIERARLLDAIVLTEKDWTKLERRSAAWPCPVFRPILQLSFDSGWDQLAARLETAASRTSPTLSSRPPAHAATP